MYMAQLSVAPLRRKANGLGHIEIDRGHPHVIYSREKRYEKPGYGLKPSGIRGVRSKKRMSSNSNFYRNFRCLNSVLCAKRQHLTGPTVIDLISIVHMDKIWVEIANKF